MPYRNTARGARTIHLTHGGYVLLEPGAVSDIDPARVKRLAPDIVEESDVPPIPNKLTQQVTGTSPEVSMALKKGELLAIAKAEGVSVETDDNKADLIRKIETARK